MKKSYQLKLALDIILFISFVVIFNFTHGSFHEIAGLGTGILFLIHILINLKKLKNAALRLFHSSTPAKMRFKYGMNILLLVSLVITIASGILISRALFPGIGSQQGFRGIHSLLANLSLGLVGIHIGLHWSELISYIRQIFSVPLPKLAGSLGLLAIVLLLMFGGYRLVAQQIPGTYSGNQGFALRAQHQAQNHFWGGTRAVTGGNGLSKSPQAQATQPSGRFNKEHKNANPLGLIFNSAIIIGIAALTHRLTMGLSSK